MKILSQPKTKPHKTSDIEPNLPLQSSMVQSIFTCSKLGAESAAHALNFQIPDLKPHEGNLFRLAVPHIEDREALKKFIMSKFPIKPDPKTGELRYKTMTLYSDSKIASTIDLKSESFIKEKIAHLRGLNLQIENHPSSED